MDLGVGGSKWSSRAPRCTLSPVGRNTSGPARRVSTAGWPDASNQQSAVKPSGSIHHRRVRYALAKLEPLRLRSASAASSGGMPPGATQEPSMESDALMADARVANCATATRFPLSSPETSTTNSGSPARSRSSSSDLMRPCESFFAPSTKSSVRELPAFDVLTCVRAKGRRFSATARTKEDWPAKTGPMRSIFSEYSLTIRHGPVMRRRRP
mmetsp:Transcript_58317/g.160059  ORF Transcript_58317/g.160059 Transcript_58317/m.160059 type:complete len:212 (+) Transcript_58317:1683-2318(+)